MDRSMVRDAVVMAAHTATSNLAAIEAVVDAVMELLAAKNELTAEPGDTLVFTSSYEGAGISGLPPRARTYVAMTVRVERAETVGE